MISLYITIKSPVYGIITKTICFQLQQLVVSRGINIQQGQSLTTTAGNQAQTAIFSDGILTIPTIAAQPTSEIVAPQSNIQHLLLQQPITALNVGQTAQQNVPVAGQVSG